MWARCEPTSLTSKRFEDFEVGVDDSLAAFLLHQEGVGVVVRILNLCHPRQHR